MDDAMRNDLRRALEHELDSLDRQLAEHGIGEKSGESVDTGIDEGFADSAQATAERSELVSLVEQLTSTRAEVVDAMARMEAGTYGRCERCGQDIATERLQALPSAPLCVTCKQALAS